MKVRESKLRNILKANALFSLVSGLVLILFPEDTAIKMNLTNNLPLVIIGLGLILFAAIILFISYKKSLNYQFVKSIILQDLLWVLGSIILLIVMPFGISVWGNILISLIAVIVFCFAFLQYKYSK